MVRDTRFSHDKSPYNPAFRAHIAPMGKLPVPVGYYLMLKPGGQSFLGGGLFADMFKDATRMVRDYIAEHGGEWEAVVTAPSFRECFTVKGTWVSRNAPARVSPFPFSRKSLRLHPIVSPFRHLKACKGLVQIIIKRLHPAEYLHRFGQKQLAVRKLFVLDGIFQIPAFKLQIFSLGMFLFVSSRDVFQGRAFHGKALPKRRRGDDRLPLAAMTE